MVKFIIYAKSSLILETGSSQNVDLSRPYVKDFVRFFKMYLIVFFLGSAVRILCYLYKTIRRKIKNHFFLRGTYVYTRYIISLLDNELDRATDRSCDRASERANKRLRKLHLRYKSRNLDNDLCATVTTASHVRSQGIRAAWRETHACTHLGVHIHMTRISAYAGRKIMRERSSRGRE